MADLGHSRCVVVVDVKVRPQLTSSIDEEANCVVLADAIEVLGSRQCQRLNDELMLAPHPQHRAARHHELQFAEDYLAPTLPALSGIEAAEARR